jgi:DMSO/TMAO reductase YedYZ molybdopterin-dependent catalytic subunit
MSKVRLSTLILPADSTRFEQVSAEFQMLRVLGNCVQTEDGEFQFGVAGISVRLILARSKVSDKAVHVLVAAIEDIISRPGTNNE